MNWARTLKVISNIVYGVGALITLCLGIISIFGPSGTANPEAMIPFTLKDKAFIWLAAGAIPMLLACMAVYKLNGVKNSTHKKRNVFLIFLPGFFCSLYALFLIGVVIAGMINTFKFY
ncbi:MAG TPA: hypothetical protein VHT34_00500 [Clostridia bacterium]|nr:hypothetical protein [Clostridia bacterium]